jgi:hypothetical protein
MRCHVNVIDDAFFTIGLNLYCRECRARFEEERQKFEEENRKLREELLEAKRKGLQRPR